MISPVDVLCLAVIVGLIALECNRGIVPAVVDLACLAGGLVVVRVAYVPLSEHMLPSTAYLVALIAVVVFIAILSILVTRRLNINVTPLEATAGAVLGLLSGLILSWAILEWLVIRYGSGAPIVRESLFSWLFFDLAGFREFAGFVQTLMGR